MTHETHQLVSLSVTWLTSSDKSGKSTEADYIVSSTCQCGAVLEWHLRLGLLSSDQLEELHSGLIAAALAAGGRLVSPPRLRGSSSDLHTS